MRHDMMKHDGRPIRSMGRQSPQFLIDALAGDVRTRTNLSGNPTPGTASGRASHCAKLPLDVPKKAPSKNLPLVAVRSMPSEGTAEPSRCRGLKRNRGTLIEVREIVTH
jgi:hypothetical protein